MSRLISVKVKPVSSATEPVTLEEVKDYLKIEYPDEDDLIESLISSGRSKCEKIAGLCFIKSEVEGFYLNGGDKVELFYSNILKDNDGNYIIDGDYDIVGDGNKKWILTNESSIGVAYTSGFDVVPEWAKTAIKEQVAWDYENRGDGMAKGLVKTLMQHRKTLHEFIL